MGKVSLSLTTNDEYVGKVLSLTNDEYVGTVSLSLTTNDEYVGKVSLTLTTNDEYILIKRVKLYSI